MSLAAPRILGIDPGLRVTGFGVIEKHGNNLVYVASGCIKSNDKQSLPERIKTLFAGISEVIASYQPDQAAVEKVFVNVNPQSTLLLGQARGAAISALVNAGLPVAEYTALQVKQAVVGHGKAAKEQVQDMVVQLAQTVRLADVGRCRCAGVRHCSCARRTRFGGVGHCRVSHSGRPTDRIGTCVKLQYLALKEIEPT